MRLIVKGQIVWGGIIAKTSYESLVACPESNKKGTVTSIKIKDEVGMAGLKSTQTRFVEINNHFHYTSLCLLFLPIVIDVNWYM